MTDPKNDSGDPMPFDNAIEATQQVAGQMTAFFKQLLDNGFTREEALTMTTTLLAEQMHWGK